MSEPKDRLIVALDVDRASKAMMYVHLLKSHVGLFKVGLQLFVAEGPPLVSRIVDSGCRVFLDLKLNDIPHQVAGAAASATRLGVSMLTMHTLGGWRMLYAASESAAETAIRLGMPKPALLGVTVLTSLDDDQLRLVGINCGVANEVHRLACLAESSGLDGVVASPREARLLRESGLSRLLIVTPGVRPARSRTQDQVRVLSPIEALEEGADYLVVGRPILQASDPVHATQMILEEMSLFRGRTQVHERDVNYLPVDESPG